MKAKVLGIESVDYVSKKTNKQVVGTNVHLCYLSDRVDGEACERVYISSNSTVDLNGVKPGMSVVLSYNRWGSVESLELVK